MAQRAKKPVKKEILRPKTRFHALDTSPYFAKIYALGGIIVLAVSTIIWATLGAILQKNNADQFSNAYLFQRADTFREALMPAQHSFLLKWPLFWLVKLFDYSPAAFAGITIAISLTTVGLFAYLLYRVERRALVFGTLCLGLASVLLLIPPMPYAGGLLPVNMAMLTTRNIEYIIFIVSLILLVRVQKIRSFRFALVVLPLTVLIASDKLFLSVGAGGALIALVFYALSKGWNLVSVSVNWLIGILTAGLAASGLLWLINNRGLTHITDDSGFGPYGLIHNIHDFGLGIIYATSSILTNFGANPAFDATTLRRITSDGQARILSPSGPSYLINICILTCACVSAWKLINWSRAHNKDTSQSLDIPAQTAVMLIWSTIAAIGLFIASRHYFAVDARYLTIAMFAGFFAIATVVRKKTWESEKIIVLGALIFAGILLSFFDVSKTFQKDQKVFADVKSRNASIVQALDQHPVNVLVGDYWRVLPTKAASKLPLNIMPLGGCTEARGILSSRAWEVDLTKNSFAYLLSFDKALTDYPHCSLDQVVDAYGRPNASLLVAGTLENPQELLLFYDKGSRQSSPATTSNSQAPATVLPIALEDIPYTSCPVPSVMNIVAHEDDDLLFMNPDLIHDYEAGHCIRTIYMTAGDAGSNKFYWLGREQGATAAYAKMLGTDVVWIYRIVKIADNQFITISNPRGNSKISLIFMHLPDGNMRGEGFDASKHESLEHLEANGIEKLDSVDGQSVYSPTQLVGALTALMQAYHPSEIRTQANFPGSQYTDHSDHMAVGKFTKKAYAQYETLQFEGHITIPIRFYKGYPVHELPENVAGEDLKLKQAMFLEYGKFDGAVCHTIDECNKSDTYKAYLRRQYTFP